MKPICCDFEMIEKEVEQANGGNSSKSGKDLPAVTVVPGRLYHLVGEILAFTVQVDRSPSSGIEARQAAPASESTREGFQG